MVIQTKYRLSIIDIKQKSRILESQNRDFQGRYDGFMIDYELFSNSGHKEIVAKSKIFWD